MSIGQVMQARSAANKIKRGDTSMFQVLRMLELLTCSYAWAPHLLTVWFQSLLGNEDDSKLVDDGVRTLCCCRIILPHCCKSCRYAARFALQGRILLSGNPMGSIYFWVRLNCLQIGVRVAVIDSHVR